MFLGRVVGEVWATRKSADLEGKRLLVIEALDERREPGAPKVTPVVAADPLGAAFGQRVIVAFGKAARVACGGDGEFAFEAAVVGIVDELDAPLAPALLPPRPPLALPPAPAASLPPGPAPLLPPFPATFFPAEPLRPSAPPLGAFVGSSPQAESAPASASRERGLRPVRRRERIRRLYRHLHPFARQRAPAFKTFTSVPAGWL